MFKILEDNINDYRIVKVIGEKDGKQTIEVWISPEDGMTICKIVVGEHTIVDWNLERCKKGATYGVPILYPTPNRVENGEFSFEGESYKMAMHGMANHETFNIEGFVIEEEYAEVVGVLEFNSETSAYSKFPFESTLSVILTISHESVKFGYTIANHDKKILPYGLALHPFFTKIGEVQYRTPAKSLMEMTDEKLPTGKLIEVEETQYDLSEYLVVDAIELDHVYTQIEEGIQAEIWYKDLGLKVALESSKEFSHLVVFTPAEQDFFCLENQSCSTNAHNMYAKGFKEVSGLEQVEPNETKKGYIEYKFTSLLR